MCLVSNISHVALWSVPHMRFNTVVTPLIGIVGPLIMTSQANTIDIYKVMYIVE